jgi:hypothetical protein
MNKFIQLAVVTAISITAYAAVGANPTTDKNKAVNETALKLSREAIARKIATRIYTEVTGVPAKMTWRRIVTYKWLKDNKKQDPDARKVLKAIDKTIADKEIALENVKYYKPSNSFSYRPAYWSADLKVGKRRWPITYIFVVDRDNKPNLKLRVSGLDKIYCGPPPLSKQNIKPIPFEQADNVKIKQLRTACSAPVPKEEFETNAEHWKRIIDARIKAYKEFKKFGIADKVYELDYSNRRSSDLEYSVEKKILYYSSVIDALSGIAYRHEFISKNSRSIQSAVIDFAGALENSGHAYAGFMAIACSAAEAKKLKHNLGDSWKFRKMKLWLKFNLAEREWDIIKVFILPNKK